MQTQRLRSPQGNGSVLAVPPLELTSATLDANIARFAGWDYDFQGRNANHLRAMARAEVLKLARAFHLEHGLDLPGGPSDPARMVITGHQPELFHPGVWVKNFALGGIARRSNAIGLNLIVDNDIPKGPSIRVPFRDGDHLRAAPLDFDTWRGELPYEDQRVVDEDLFAGFAGSVRERIGDLLDQPLLDSFWPRVLRRRAATDRVGLRFALARHELEVEMGTHNWEVPLSQVCQTEAFGWFASHLLAHLPRFREVHNAALNRYRAAYKIRSKNHPVPALAQQDDWLEAPFWVWRQESPRRKSLLVRQGPKTLELRIAGEDTPFVNLPLSSERDACCAVEPLLGIAKQGVRLRTRALTTTMFARYLLGDLFLHGIGGAKYDELGDEIARNFFGVEPPAFQTLTMTEWLPLPDAPATIAQVNGIHHQLRDLQFNPDRHLGEPRPAESRPAVEAKWVAIEGEVATRSQRQRRLRVIRQANADLASFVQTELSRQNDELTQLQAGLKLNAVAHSREYAFPLHSAAQIEKLMAHVVASVR